MADKLDYQAQDISRSVLYGPLPRALDESVQRTIDEERKVLDNAFFALEQGVGLPVIKEVQAQNISVGSPPAALVITGSGFGTDDTKVYLEVGPDTAGPFVATTAGHTDTNATFDISTAAGLTASRVIQLTVIVQESATKMVRSYPVSVPTVA